MFLCVCVELWLLLGKLVISPLEKSLSERWIVWASAGTDPRPLVLHLLLPFSPLPHSSLRSLSPWAGMSVFQSLSLPVSVSISLSLCVCFLQCLPVFLLNPHNPDCGLRVPSSGLGENCNNPPPLPPQLSTDHFLCCL